MHLDDDSYHRLSEWMLYGDTGTDGDNQLIFEFLRTLENGTWAARWHRVRDLSAEQGTQRWVVSLRDGLRLVLVLDFDGEPDLAHVQAIDSGAGWHDH